MLSINLFDRNEFPIVKFLDNKLLNGCKKNFLKFFKYYMNECFE